MAHGIRSNDTVLLARTKAWHGLGIVLPDQFAPAEALSIGGLDWSVEESTALTATFVEADGSAERAVIDTHKTLRRSDDRSILGTVGSGYTPVQNRTLAEIAESFNAAGVRVETAGSLHGGRKVWFLLDGGSVDVGGKGDITNRFIMLHNAHDGTASLGGDLVKTRVVCNNTYTGALNENGGFFRYRHTSGIALRVEDAKQALAAFRDLTAKDNAAMQALAAKTLTRAQIQELWLDVLVALDGPIAVNPKTESESRRKQKAVDALADMSRVFDREAAQFGGTAWVAANAVTNYIQYHRGRLTGDARTSSDLFGSYAEAKRLTMRKALATV
jgi:phage/plasmid-like protein (TIGR03299 family)